MNWEFALPVKIIFGVGKRKNIAEYIDEIGGTNGVLVCGQSFVKNGTADEFVKNSNGRITAVFSDIRPNPTTENVNDCVSLLRKTGADFAVALPMIAFSTTSGTASEVTNISVLTDVAQNLKNPMNDPAMYPKIAVIDPELTLSVPKQITASTGLDVLAHAVESYWSTLNQPICTACSVYSAKLVFEWLIKAYENPNDLEAREKMAEASIVAGVAFSHPRTTGSHACSFPLTNIYGVPHGEACAFTLDYFIKFNEKNANADGRITALANACGFETASEMADRISDMKKQMGMRTRLSEIDCTTDEQIRELTEKSMSMLMTRNPIALTEEDIFEMYQKLR